MSMDFDGLERELLHTRIFADPKGFETSLGEGDVERFIPHRAPLRLIDSVDALDKDGERIRCARTLDPDDPVFAGHFPGNPIYPGVLLLEMTGQAGLCLAWLLEASDPRAAMAPVDVRIVRIQRAAFLEPVRPGERVLLEARRIVDDGLTAVLAGQVWGSDRLRAAGIFEVYYA